MTSKQRTITLTNRRPVTINEDDWPVIAKAACKYSVPNDPGEFGEWALWVRQHADGRTLVYGTRNIDDDPYPGNWNRAGTLLGAGFDPIEPIRSTGRDLFAPERLTAECIATLPPEVI